MKIYKRLPIILILLLIPAFALSFWVAENPVYPHREIQENTVSTDLNIIDVENPLFQKREIQEIIISPGLQILNEDPVMNLLGASFTEVEQVLGEPDEQGTADGLDRTIIYFSGMKRELCVFVLRNP